MGEPAAVTLPRAPALHPGADVSGGYAELALAFAPSVIPIPPGMEPDVAAGVVVAGLAATVILTEAVALGEVIIVGGLAEPSRRAGWRSRG